MIDQKPFFWPRVYDRGLIYIYQLFHRGAMKSAAQLAAEFNISTLQYNSLLTVIPVSWKKTFSELTTKVFLPAMPHNLDMLNNTKHLSKIIYTSMTGDLSLIHNKAMKWNQILSTEWDMLQFGKMHEEIKKITNYTKMRDFQYRLLQRALITNIQLKQWGITQSEACTFCNREPESVMHLLFQCPTVFALWENFTEFCLNEFGTRPDISPETIITNRFCTPIGHVINAIGLFLKQYIYSKRCLKEPLIFGNFIRYIIKIKNIEKYIALKNDRLVTYVRKWESNQPREQNLLDIDEYARIYIQELDN